MPGYSINSFTFQEAKGFGRYELSYPLKDLFNKKEQRYFANISRAKLTYGIDGIFNWINRYESLSGFDIIEYYYVNKEPENNKAFREIELPYRNEKTLQYLKELNPLSYISMSIVFDKGLTMEEFQNLREENSNLQFKWVGIRTVEPGIEWRENQRLHLIGFNPYFNDEPSSGRRPDPEKYPLYYLGDIWNNPDFNNMKYPEKIYEGYEIHFRSRLNYMRNRKDFVNIFDYNSYKTDFYDASLKYIDEHGVKTYGVLVYGTAEDFLDRIDTIPYDNLYINEVLPVKPNIYR